MIDLTEAQKTWGASPTGWASAKDEVPGTRAFFEKARHFRDTVEQPWLDEVFPFGATSGKRVLEIGFGPGYDALKFIQAGADYSGIDITSENIERTRNHLGFFDLEPDVGQGDAEHLPFPDASFDVVYSNGVLHHVPDLSRALVEIRRVMRPNGELAILMYHRRSVFYAGVALVHFLSGGFLRRTLADRRSKIEATTADAKPIVNVYSRRELAGILEAGGFNIDSILVRKCLPEDFPGASILPWHKIPQAWLDALGRHAGWYLIARARLR